MTDDINDILDNEIDNILNKKKDVVKTILVLSGGATKGIAQIGALHCLKRHNMLDSIKTIAATSAGSMVGLLYAVGYQPLELYKFIKLLNLGQTKKLDTGNVITNYGFDNGIRMMLVLRKMITAKGFSENVTFKEMYHKTLINFIVTGSCVNDKKVYYFSHIDYPDMRVLDAIRISISIPIIFTPCTYEGKIFVDGGCIDNFPIHLFNNEMDKVIGIYVSEERKPVPEIKYIEDYLINIIHCLFEGAVHRETMSYGSNVIHVKCTNCSESSTDIISMFEAGYGSAQQKIDEWNLQSKT